MTIWEKSLPLRIKTLQHFRRDGFSLTSLPSCETSRNPPCAYRRISQSVNNYHSTSTADWKLYGHLPTCDAHTRINYVIGGLQRVGAGGCAWTPKPRSIMQLSFSTFWSLKSLNSATNGALSPAQLPCAAGNRFSMFPTFRFSATKSSLRACYFNVSDKRHSHRLLQWRYLSDDLILICAINISVATAQFSHCYILEWGKMWGITFWTTLTYFGSWLLQWVLAD